MARGLQFAVTSPRHSSGRVRHPWPSARPEAPPPSALRPALRDSFQCCHSGDIEEDLQSLVDWDWLEEVQGHLFATGAGSFNSCHMWAGAGGGSTPVHFDALSNFLAQVSGTKRVLLFPAVGVLQIVPLPCEPSEDDICDGRPSWIRCR